MEEHTIKFLEMLGIWFAGIMPFVVMFAHYLQKRLKTHRSPTRFCFVLSVTQGGMTLSLIIIVIVNIDNVDILVL